MADDREPPPLFDEDNSTRNDDGESDDLFSSAVQSHELAFSTTNGHHQITPAVQENLFSGGGTEINLDDDDDESYAHPSVDQPVATTLVTSETMLSAPGSLGASKSLIPSSKSVEESREDASSDPFIDITITDPLKIGDGMSAFMAYRVCTKTNLTFFKNKQFSVVRRFSDFLGLHDKLVEKHSHLGRIVPPAPEKSVVGMTKIKMSKENEGNGGNAGGVGGGTGNSATSSLDFVEKRRSALERFLRRTAAHPVLQVDPDFREFLEMDEELPRATNTSTLSGASVLRLFNRVGDTVSKITFKMDETDPWFEEKQQQIENLDLQLKKLHNSIETLVHYRRELAQSTGVFSKSVAMLSNCEEHTTLSRALSQLAGVEDRVDQIHQQQGHNDFYILAELMKDYINLIGAIKDVFHQRVKVYQTWQHAQQCLTKKREQKASLEVKGKTDKLPQAREEVVEWEAKVERGQEEFENISKMIRKEIDRFEYNRIKDFKETIVKYMDSLMNNQQQLIKCWEGFLPEAKAIA